MGRRVHLACPAMAIYPCAYRTLRLEPQTEGTWQLAWQTHPVANAATTAEAGQRMLKNWLAVDAFSVDFGQQYVQQAFGREGDRQGKANLS
ncbi:MAG: hypothetical protein JW953_01160 [Anaerolineae bacterium]|nr:hypothetical protein [Anaerolineae bacterium]